MTIILNKLTKLAYENPHLRKELLPLITKLAVKSAGYEVDIAVDISDFKFENYREDPKKWGGRKVSRIRWHAKGKISFTLTKDGTEIANVQNKDWSTDFNSGAHRSQGPQGYTHSFSADEYLKNKSVNELKRDVVNSLLNCSRASLPKEVWRILDQNTELDVEVNNIIATDVKDGLQSLFQPALNSLDFSAHEQHNKLNSQEEKAVKYHEDEMKFRFGK
jgi:hypothetical protein